MLIGEGMYAKMHGRALMALDIQLFDSYFIILLCGFTQDKYIPRYV